MKEVTVNAIAFLEFAHAVATSHNNEPYSMLIGDDQKITVTNTSPCPKCGGEMNWTQEPPTGGLIGVIWTCGCGHVIKTLPVGGDLSRYLARRRDLLDAINEINEKQKKLRNT